MKGKLRQLLAAGVALLKTTHTLYQNHFHAILISTAPCQEPRNLFCSSAGVFSSMSDGGGPRAYSTSSPLSNGNCLIPAKILYVLFILISRVFWWFLKIWVIAKRSLGATTVVFIMVNPCGQCQYYSIGEIRLSIKMCLKISSAFFVV